MVYVLILILSIQYYSIIILLTENIMSNRPRNTEMKRGKWVPVGANKYPNIEEYRTANREARAQRRTKLAEQIADRITPVNCQTIMKITNDIHVLAHNMELWHQNGLSIEPIKIIELQNHIHELQTYLVRIEETAIGMHD